MKKLNDLHRVLLATAGRRDDGSLLPLPDTLNAPSDRVRRAIAGLLKAGYAEENTVQDAARTWREYGDARFGVRITDAGRAAIGIVDAAPDEEAAQMPVANGAEPAKKQTKAALVLTMLSRAEGATIAELTAATGWLPHSARAALTGLRKKAHPIERGKRGEETVYQIESAN